MKKNTRNILYMLLFLIVLCLIYLNTNTEGFAAPTANDTVNRAFVESYSNLSTMLHEINIIKPTGKYYILNSSADNALKTKIGQLGIAYFTLTNYYYSDNRSYNAIPANLNSNFYRYGNDPTWGIGGDYPSSTQSRDKKNWIALPSNIRTEYINKLNAIGSQFNTLNNIIRNSNTVLTLSNRNLTRETTDKNPADPINLNNIFRVSNSFNLTTFVCSNVTCT